MEYQYTPEMQEISGFGGDYEEACRKMVIAGMKWFDKNPDVDVKFAEYENVYGITTDHSEDCEKLQKAMLEAVGDCTGAMMQACLNHVMYAHKHGWEKYVEEMSKKEEEE